MVNELFQSFYDWYILGFRDFYQRHIHRFFQRRNLVAVSGEHGFLDMCPLPLGYSTLELNERLMERTRRRFDKAAGRY